MPALAPPPAALAALPDVALAPIRFAVRGGDPIGQRRSGMVCGPAGRLFWRDTAVDGEALATSASRDLRGQGLSIATVDPDIFDSEQLKSKARIVATVEHVAMRACLPWRGSKLKTSAGPVRATGRVLITWRVFDVARAQLSGKVATCSTFATERASTLKVVFERAFGDVAVAVVPAIDRYVAEGREDGAIAIPAALVCPKVEKKPSTRTFDGS